MHAQVKALGPLTTCTRLRHINLEGWCNGDHGVQDLRPMTALLLLEHLNLH